MSVRAAELQDAPGIAQVHIASWQVAYRGLLPDSLLDNLSLNQRTLEWQEILSADDGQILVYTQTIEIGTEIVGFAGIGKCRDEDLAQDMVGELYAIYLRPDCWGKGYGAALLGAAIAWLQAQGYPVITLWVLDGNQRAIHFYEAHGFRADGRIQEETLPGGIDVRELRYRHSLTINL